MLHGSQYTPAIDESDSDLKEKFTFGNMLHPFLGWNM